MTRWIRWQGLVPFVVVAGLLAAFWLLIFDGLVKRAIEKTGTLIVGAEVDVRDVDVSLFPLAITLDGLQVTNPDDPATNSVECGTIAFSLDSLNLLRRKVIIDQMAVEDVRFDTPRKRPGFVRSRLEEKKGEEKKSVFGLTLEKPDVKKILRNENLESVKLIETAKQEMRNKKSAWQQKMEEIPDKATIENYQDRIRKIRKMKKDVTGLAKQLKEARALRRDIEQDLGKVKQVRAAFKNDLTAAKRIVERAEQAPGSDVRRLRDKYSITPAGLANISDLLFGDEISSWVRTGLLWYNRIQPVVERAKAQREDVAVVKPLRGEGVDIRFREVRPLPDFLIDRAAVSVETAAGYLAGAIRNITPDQNILGVPLTFSFTGEKLKKAKSAAVTGTLNHTNPARQQDRAQFSMSGFKLRKMVLSNDKDLPISMQDAIVDFNLDGLYTRALKATFTAKVRSAGMTVGGEGRSNPFVTSIRSALSKVSNFSLSADITGTLQDYKMNISSDLDRVLKNAVSNVVRAQRTRLERELKTKIRERTGGQLRDLRESFGGLTEQGGRLDKVQEQLYSVLEEAIKSATGKLRLR